MNHKYLILISILLAITQQSVLPSQKYIRKIEIKRANVFDSDLAEKSRWYYRLANSLHIKTREGTIRQELTFGAGRPFAISDLEESLRNLRSLEYIGEVRAEVVDVTTDSVDLIIYTEDLWTTVFGIAGEGGGGKWEIETYGNEKNLIGRGITLACLLQFDSDKNNGWGLQAKDRRFAGLPLSIELWTEHYALSNRLTVGLAKPLYSLKDRWSFSLSGGYHELTRRLYDSGVEILRFRQYQETFGLEMRRVFGVYRRAIPFMTFFYRRDDFDKKEESDMNPLYIPQDEKQIGPGIGILLTDIKYDTSRFIDEPGGTEDISLNLSGTFSAANFGKRFGGDTDFTLLNIELKSLHKYFGRAYLGIRNDFSSRYNGGRGFRAVNSAEAAIYVKPALLHTLALRWLSISSWRQNPDYQLLLGGASGLRGYPDRGLDGSRLFLLNCEYRYFAPFKVLTVVPGAAVFFDAGYAWESGDEFRFGELRKNLGAGLRFGLSKSSTAKIIRIDLAWALDARSTYVSFGTGNVFDLKSFQ